MSLSPKDFTTTSLHSRGFTLIELLVVISILGIMAAVGLFTYTTVLNKARDTKIKADLDSIGKAYEFRYNFSTNTYGDVLPADFDSGQIPKKPDGMDYPTCSPSGCTIPSTDKTTFRICIILSNGTDEYCRASIRKEPTADATFGGISGIQYKTKIITCTNKDSDPATTGDQWWTPAKVCLSEAGSSYVPTVPPGLTIFARGAWSIWCTNATDAPTFACLDLSCNATAPVGCNGVNFYNDSTLDLNFAFAFPRPPETQDCGGLAAPNQKWTVRVACGIP